MQLFLPANEKDFTIKSKKYSVTHQNLKEPPCCIYNLRFFKTFTSNFDTLGNASVVLCLRSFTASKKSVGRLKQTIAAPEALSKLKSMNGINQQIKTLIDKLPTLQIPTSTKEIILLFFAAVSESIHVLRFGKDPCQIKKLYSQTASCWQRFSSNCCRHFCETARALSYQGGLLQGAQSTLALFISFLPNSEKASTAWTKL